MKLVFNQTLANNGDKLKLTVINRAELDEQLFHNQMLPIFYKLSPGLDDKTGRLISGYKSHETMTGPCFMLIEEDKTSRIYGLEVHESMLNDLVVELENLGHEVVLE